MLSAIAGKFGVVIAVVLSSLVFTFLHFDPRGSWIFVANVLLFAAFACCWAIRTGNVWGIMGWHGTWNWLLAVGFGLRVIALDAHVPALLVQLTPVGPDYLTGGIEGPEGIFSAVWSSCAELRSSFCAHVETNRRRNRRGPCPL